jgi:hypothetical protein
VKSLVLNTQLPLYCMFIATAEHPSVYAPPNVLEVTDPYTHKQMLKNVIELRFQRPKRAKAVGKLAEDSLSGVSETLITSHLS